VKYKSNVYEKLVNIKPEEDVGPPDRRHAVSSLNPLFPGPKLITNPRPGRHKEFYFAANCNLWGI
jgi:hypothetical protein